MNRIPSQGRCPFFRLLFIAAILIASLDAPSPRFAKAQSKGYRAVSIGVGSGLKAGMGLEKGMGVALDWNGGIQFYGTSIIS